MTFKLVRRQTIPTIGYQAAICLVMVSARAYLSPALAGKHI
jgi:hypothetical protein